MANEIKQAMQLSCTNGSFSTAAPQLSLSINQSAVGALQGVTAVTTSEADLSLTGLTTPGWVWMRNLDATNYVKVGPKSGGVMVECIRLKPGEAAMFRLGPSGVTLRWVANTATCNVQWMVLSD